MNGEISKRGVAPPPLINQGAGVSLHPVSGERISARCILGRGHCYSGLQEEEGASEHIIYLGTVIDPYDQLHVSGPLSCGFNGYLTHILLDTSFKIPKHQAQLFEYFQSHYHTLWLNNIPDSPQYWVP